MSQFSKEDEAWVKAGSEHPTALAQRIIQEPLSESLRKQLAYYQKIWGYALFSEVFVTNTYGVNIASTTLTSDYYQADELWWQETVRKGSFIGDVAYDDSSGVYSMELCEKIVDGNGEFLGVLKVVLNIEETIAIAKDVSLTTSAQVRPSNVVLANNKGGVFYSSKPFEMLKPTPRLDLSMISETQNEKDGKIIHHRSASGSGELMVQAYSNGFGTYPGLGWLVEFDYEIDDIFSPVVRMIWTVGLVVGVVFLVSLLLGGWLIFNSLKPLKKLTLAADRISRGEYNQTVDIHTHDEAGQLARVFDTMSREINNHKTELEQKVKDKTEALELQVQDTQKKNLELEQMNCVLVGRELKMMELKKENELLKGGNV
jgi:methyl-accepting chemotaxis protein